MIRIDRSKLAAPQALLRDGPAHLASTIEPLASSGRLRSSDFDRSIYCSDELRLRLWRMQHGKCCFCEKSYEDKHSTVEHFRPKAEASDDTSDQGKQTVRAVELDQRDTLKLLRGNYYARHISPLIERHRKAKARGDAAALAEARADALRLAGPSAEFAGMARYALRRAGIL